MWKILVVVAVTVVAIGGCKERPGKGEPGADLLKSRCGRCHPFDVKKNHTTKEEWEQTVTKMMGKGAVLNNDEKGVLVDFLVKYYHP